MFYCVPEQLHSPTAFCNGKCDRWQNKPSNYSQMGVAMAFGPGLQFEGYFVANGVSTPARPAPDLWSMNQNPMQ